MSSFTVLDPKLFDVFRKKHDGYPDRLAREDTPSALRDACGYASRDFPASFWIEPKDWEDYARENDKHKTHPINRIDRFTNQSPTHECTTHSLRANIEGCWNFQRGIIYPEGPKKGYRYPESEKLGSVWFSPLSVYAEANPRMWGGANVRQVLEIACRRGILPETIQPKNYGFKHALHGTTGKGGTNQANGKWVAVRNFPEGWQETAKLFRPLEVIFPGSWEEAVCLVLHGHFVSVGRSGHAIPWGQYLPGQGMAYPDSYDVIRYDSMRTVKSAWRGAFSIVSMTVPDDWKQLAA